MKKTTLELRVRYVETDQMGVAHHSSYFPWMEAARTELMRELGMSYRELEGRGFYLPVAEAYCRYKHSLRYDDIAVIETEVLEIRGASLKIGYRMREKASGRTVAEGYTLHPFVDSSGNVVRIPDFFKKLMGAADL
jgi:acyl-CoA thioester hydrolase